MKISLSLPEGPLPGGLGWHHFAVGSLPVIVEQAAHRIFRDRYSRSATAWISWTAGLAVTALVASSASFHMWISCMGLYLTYYSTAASFRQDVLDPLIYLDQHARTLAPIYDEIIKCVNNGLSLQQIERCLRQHNSNSYLIVYSRASDNIAPFRLPNSPAEKTHYVGLVSAAPAQYDYNFSLLNDTGFICDRNNIPMESYDLHEERRRYSLLYNRPQPLPASSAVD
jgi:hypothetical protein